MDDKELIGKHLQYAFPDPGRAQSEKQLEKLTEKGMSLRDYFAAKALSPIVAAETEGHAAVNRAKVWAEEAYIVADAMLAAREA